MRHRNIVPHDKIVDNVVEKLRVSDHDLSRHVARAIILQPLPPDINSVRDDIFGGSDKIKTEWSFLEPGARSENRLTKIATFTMWIGEKYDDLFLSLDVRIAESGNVYVAHLSKKSNDPHVELHDNTFVNDQHASEAIHHMVDDMEYGVMSYEVPALAQMKSSIAFNARYGGADPELVQEYIDEANDLTEKHRTQYGIK